MSLLGLSQAFELFRDEIDVSARDMSIAALDEVEPDVGKRTDNLFGALDLRPTDSSFMSATLDASCARQGRIFVLHLPDLCTGPVRDRFSLLIEAQRRDLIQIFIHGGELSENNGVLRLL